MCGTTNSITTLSRELSTQWFMSTGQERIQSTNQILKRCSYPFVTLFKSDMMLLFLSCLCITEREPKHRFVWPLPVSCYCKAPKTDLWTVFHQFWFRKRRHLLQKSSCWIKTTEPISAASVIVCCYNEANDQKISSSVTLSSGQSVWGNTDHYSPWTSWQWCLLSCQFLSLFSLFVFKYSCRNLSWGEAQINARITMNSQCVHLPLQCQYIRRHLPTQGEREQERESALKSAKFPNLFL